jgi:ribosomal protein S27AE
MTKHLLLVDYENVHTIDLSRLDDSYRAIIFVGASQNPPKAARLNGTAHRFRRVDFQKITGNGKNALDFHIAFHLGRAFETDRETICIVLSRDKGFDPLLLYLNKNGLPCRRVERFEDVLSPEPTRAMPDSSVTLERIVCARCGKTSTIEHHGGRWCTNCGRFASPPDPALLPSNQPGYREVRGMSVSGVRGSTIVCDWCHQPSDMSDGIYDDGEWMCGGCVAGHAR